MILALVVLVLYAASKGEKSAPRRRRRRVSFSPQIKRSVLVPPRVLTDVDPFGKNTFG